MTVHSTGSVGFSLRPELHQEWRATVTLAQLRLSNTQVLTLMSPMPQLTDSQKGSHQSRVGLVFLEAKAQEMENLEQLQHKLIPLLYS